MIVIFTSENDLSTLEVAKWLNHFKQEFYIINPSEEIFKFKKITNEGIFFTHNILKKDINLLNAKACWWRRTGLGVKNFVNGSLPKELEINGMDLKELISGRKSLIHSEFNDLKEYIFDSVYINCKINMGSPRLFGLNRLTTLDIAKSKGLKIPYYEVISNTNQINSSSTIEDKFVTKAVSNGIYHQIKNKSYYSYTELQYKKDYCNQDIKVFPSLIMNLVDKKYEIRTFYLDGHFFSMAIFSQSNSQTKVDFRKYSESKPNKNEPFRLPKNIEKKLESVFKEIGLNSGSADLIVDLNNDFVFLEINPIGQYGMTSEPCNYNLDRLIAEYLINGRISKQDRVRK